jgi:hypothetical protein
MPRGKTDTTSSGLDRPKGSKINFSYIYLAAFSILTIAYLAENFLPKPDKMVLNKYHLSLAGYHWLVYPLVTLLVLIWLASLYGSLRVKSYSKLIKSSHDGRGMNRISNGLLVLTLSLPLNSNISYVVNHFGRRHADLLPTMTIINNYIVLALAATAFTLLFSGSQDLHRLIRGRIRQLPPMVWQGFFILFSSLYSYFIIAQPIHTPLARRAYFLPDWLLALTIAAPYVFFWYLGARAAYNIYLYRSNINGSLYKSALNFVALGIAVVVLGSVLTRVFISISTTITNLKLTPILIIIYGLLSVIAAGYILIAIGAKKLRRIEEA